MCKFHIRAVDNRGGWSRWCLVEDMLEEVGCVVHDVVSKGQSQGLVLEERE